MEILRLDPDRLPLWRDADTVQFGVEAEVTVRLDGDWGDRLIHELSLGIPENAFDVVAHRCGASLDEARRFRALLSPVLEREPARLAARLVLPSDFDIGVELRLRDALTEAGVDPTSGDDNAPLIVVHHGVALASASVPLVRTDTAHLPVAFHPGGAAVGPLIVPGRTPCLACRDAHDRSRDPAWAAVHSQLVERHPGPVPMRRIAATADAIADLLDQRCAAEREGSSRIVRVSADATRSSREVRFHAECHCRSPRESERADAAPVPIPVTSSRRAYARPA
ncbi:hypothetical protein BKA02_000051 [Microbacterium pseudoresistens]|uniref:Bacteriocin biosynthesis cyclodehydratase domain-containing protein n=1 Tax=Microbacterium pseudoresistens TaxID=640634 RepID=A0A7Y9ESK0_9MICO|nr:hypothetical protein [Microbacterium pseudoresistens]